MLECVRKDQVKEGLHVSQHGHKMGTLARQAVMTPAGANDFPCGLWVRVLRTVVNSIFTEKQARKGKSLWKLSLVLLGNQRDLSVKSVGKIYTQLCKNWLLI